MIMWLGSGFVHVSVFFFQAEDGIRDDLVTGVQTCALPISDQVPIDRRMEEHRRSHDEATLAIKDHAGEIARFADDGGIAGAVEMIMHFLHQARDLVAQDLNRDGVQSCLPSSSNIACCRGDPYGRPGLRTALAGSRATTRVAPTSSSTSRDCEIHRRSRASRAGSR